VKRFIVLLREIYVSINFVKNINVQIFISIALSLFTS